MNRFLATFAIALSFGVAAAAEPLVLAVYDATSEVRAEDLSDDPGLLSILAERPVNRDDVKTTINQFVYLRKATVAAREMYSRPTYRAETKGQRARLEAIYDVIIDKEIEPSLPEISEASIEAFFVENATSFMRPAQYRFQHMFRENVSGEPRAAQVKMEEASRALEAGESFAEVARAYGEKFDEPGKVVDESAGILGRAAPRLLYQLERLGPGESSGPFATEQGWGLIKLVEKTPPRPMTLDEAHDLVREHLRARLSQEAMAELVNELDARYGVERHFDRLDEKMSNGSKLLVFSIGDKEYLWQGIQRMFMFTDTQTSIHMSRAVTARPLIDNLLSLYLLELFAIEKGYDSDPRINERYQDAVNREITQSMTDLDRTIDMQKTYKPTEEEMRRYYDTHKRVKYWSPALLDLQLVYVPYLYPPNASEAEREEQRKAARRTMDEAEAKLAGGAEFGAVVAEYSKHPSTAQGGRIRGVDALRMWGAERRAEFLAANPKTYPAFEWNQGLAKVRILEASAGYALPFERVLTQIEKLDMYEEAEASRVRKIKADYVQEASIQYNWPNIVRFIRDMNKKHAVP